MGLAALVDSKTHFPFEQDLVPIEQAYIYMFIYTFIYLSFESFLFLRFTTEWWELNSNWIHCVPLEWQPAETELNSNLIHIYIYTYFFFNLIPSLF